MRPIDADALEKYLSDTEIEATRQRKYVFASALNTICGNVRNFPTIKSERKTGKWVQKHFVWFCSECGENPTKGMGYVQGHQELYDFCPKCGADMRGEQDE